MTKTARKLDVEIVRQAAAGRWLEVLERVAGIPADAMDGSHHPCPKCGGDDRFRLIDADAGAVLCNQCFSTKNGDGFAAVAWMLDVKFPEAVKRVADHLGLAAAAKGPADPAKDLEFKPWSSELAKHFLRAKPGITEQALFDAGAQMARYKRQYTVIAIPVIGQDLDPENPVGWCLYNYNGGTLPKYNKQGEQIGTVKVKITYGSKPGLVGRHAIERLKLAGLAELVWKVEGLTDLLALQSIIPENLRDRHLVVTNANGAGEIPRWPASVLAGFNTLVVHDADQPGQAGAEHWSRQIAAQSVDGASVKHVPLPFDVAETHGRDLRDFINDGRGYGDLLGLADAVQPVTVAKTASGDVDYSEYRNPVHERILQKLQIEILYEDESNAIRIFSTHQRKSSTIKDVTKLKHDALIQMCGAPAIENVVSSASDADPLQGPWSMADVRRALAALAGYRRGKSDERGVGVWQGLDNSGNETETVVLVGNTEGCRWNGDKVLRRILAPRADGLVLDFGAGSLKDWYDFDVLERQLAQAGDKQWCAAAIDEAVELFGKWRWKNPEIDPTLVAGLVLATWVQTVWDWRPLVAVSGESNSGKSFLFEALGGSQNRRGLFGSLAFKQAKSTAAGLSQGLGNTARIPLCDEFEASKERTKILEMLRQSTRGEMTAKGTSHHRGVEFVLRHIGWVAAIETGLQKQPDANRFVQLELLTAEPGQHGKLRLPEPRVLTDLGQRLLAIAIRSAIQAKRLAVGIKDTQAPGIDPRTVESYAVPAAILAVAQDGTEEFARALLLSLLENVDAEEQGRKDQEELLGDILTASIHLDSRTGTKTVAQVLESPSMRCEHAARLEAAGVRYLTDVRGIESGSVFLATKLVGQQLLRGTAWEGQKIDQLLLRLPGVARRALRVGGRMVRGLLIPPKVAAIGEPDLVDASF